MLFRSGAGVDRTPQRTALALARIALVATILVGQLWGLTVALDAYLIETAAIRETLLRSTAPEALRETARALELELQSLKETLGGNERRGVYGDPGPVPIQARLQVALMGTFRSTYGPTPTHERALEIAAESFGPLSTRLKEIERQKLPELRAALDAAGVPWTPGRSVPGIED